MGVLGQAVLLLWKNIKLRQRRPILTIAQIAWPLLIFAAIAILRSSFPAKNASECQYNARAVPSSGVLPFMQSMVCDLESSCVTDSVPSNEVPTLADAQIGQTIEDLEPVFQNDSVIDTIKALPKTLAPVNDFVETVGDTVKNVTENQPQVADFFHNATQLRNVLQDLGIPEEAVDAIFEAEVDTLEALNLLGSTSFDQLCNVTVLQQLLIFPPETDVAEVSAALCNLTSEEVSEIINQVIVGLDTLYITDEIEDFLEFVEPYGLDQFLEDVKAIRDQLENSEDLGDLLQSLPQLIQLTEFAPLIESIIEEISKDATQRLIEELISVIERIDGYLENVPWWQSFKQIVDTALKLIDTFKNTGGDARDRGIKLISLLQNSTRLSERLNITGEVLEILLQSEIPLEQIQLFLNLLENPEKAVSVICSGNISQVITLPPDVDPDAAAMFLCAFNITEVFEGIRDEIDLASFLYEFTKLLEEGSNFSNQTLDWEEVLNQTLSLIDQFNQIRETPLLETVTDFLQIFSTFTSLDTSTLEYWLGLFISSNATLGSTKNESMIIDAWLDPLLTLLQAELAQTPLWLHIQKQLIIQSLSLDLSLHLVDTFASGSCPDNWHSHTPSCYQYNRDKVDFATSLEVCLSLHSLAHPVVVNHEKEQAFLQTIGEDELSWLGLDIEGGGHFWLDGQEVSYSNWLNYEVGSECGVVNFGQDGGWYSKICTETASNLCEAPQEHAIITLIKESPLSDLSEIMLKIGPNATEALLLEIFDPSTIEMLLSKGTNLTFELCSESFVDAIGSDLPDDILTQICAWDLEAFWHSQMDYWKFPEIEQKIIELGKISITEADKIPESYQPLADFEAVISKQNMLSEAITAAAMIPLNLELLLMSLTPNVEVTGTPEEWQAVAERLNNYWYQQQLEQLMDQLVHLGNSSGLLENFIYDFQQQLVIQEVINIVVQAGNTLFEIVEDLSKGIIGDSEPETQKLLIGIEKLLESSAQIQAFIGEVLENPKKASEFFNALRQENFFCNATLRDPVLDLKEEEKQIFDDYICAVNYPVFFMEMALLLDVPEIQKLIQFYIPYNTSADLLPFPDPIETQEIWTEYVNYLININQIRNQYLETYNITKMEFLLPIPDFSNISSLVNLLDMLQPILNVYNIDDEALKIIRSAIETFLTPGSDKDPRWVESLAEVLSTWFQPTLQNLFIEDLFNVALRDIFTQLTGKVYTFPDDLGSVTEADEIEHFIPIIYRSADIVQVLFGITLDQEKMTQLIASPDVILTLCPNGPLDFFNTSFSQGVDLVSLQKDLCKVDLDAVVDQVSSYPPLAMLLSEVPYYLHQSPLPSFNWTAYFIHSEELNKAIEDFISDPLEIKVNQRWFNTTATDLLKVLIALEESQNQAMLMEQLESLQMILDILHKEISPGVVWISEIEDAVKILLGSISYSNDILETLPGQNITFEDILPPYLAEHLTKSFEYSGDINAFFLQAVVNIEELTAMSATGDILLVLCTNVSSLGTLLDLPTEVNITAAQHIICSLNETAVNVEVMREVQKILDKAQLDEAIDVMKASKVVEDFIGNVVELKHSPPNFSQFDDAWIETTARKMEAILKSLEAVQTMPSNVNDLGLEMLFQMLQDTLKDDPGFQFWLIQLRMEDYFTVLLIEQARDLVGKNISFQELNKYLGKYPSLQDILSLREVIPEIVDILLALSTNSEKLQQFWNSSMPFQSVCMAGTFSYFFEVPVNSTTNLTSLESRLCSLNKTELLSEVDSLLGLSEIQTEITKILTLDPSLPPLNFTAALFLRDVEVQSVFSELFENPPTFYFDQEFWQNTKDELEQVLSHWEEDLNKLLMPSNSPAELSSLIKVIEGQLMQYENETWYQSVLADMRLMDYVNELIIEWATDLQGKVLTLPRLDELFQNSPNIKELLELTDLTPDIIDAFLSLSLAPEKWTQFWTMENPIATLCASGEFTNFFELPEDSSSNITAVAKAVCSLNLTAVDMEINKFLGLNEIGAEISQILYNSASLGPYNWTASFILSMQVQTAVQGLIENPPIFSVDPVWWNQTQAEIAAVIERWLKRVEEMSIVSNPSTDIVHIIDTLQRELDNFKNESWYQDIVRQMRINDLANELLISIATDLQGKTLTLPTLGELFMNSTNIRKLLELSAVAPDIIDAFLSLSLQPDKWELFWTMKDPIPALCVSGNFTSFFKLLPGSTSDIATVAYAVCSLNLTAVGKEFTDLIKLDEITSQFTAILYNHPSLGPHNWTASYVLGQRLSNAVLDLILDPPIIDIDPVWWNETLKELEVVVSQWTSYLTEMIPGQVDNTSMEWLPEVISVVEEQLSAFQNESWYQDLVTQMRVMDQVNKLIIEWVTRFQGQTLTLPTLDELFENSTHVRQLLELTYLTPDLVDVFLSFSVQEEKWASFLAMDKPIATLCASGNFTIFFQLPPDSPSNITAVADAVCSVNITAVDGELKYLFQVDSILSQLSLILYNHPSLGPYNWTASYQLSQNVQKAIEDLVFNPPVFLVDPIWLNQTRTDFLEVIQRWWTRLVEMSSTDPTGMDGFAALIQMLESQLSAFQDMEWYQDLITQMRLMDEFNRIIARWINRLSGATITIPDFNELFQNVTYIKDLLELQNISPELIDVFLSLSVSPEKWETFWSKEAPIAELCASGNFSSFFVLPSNSMTDLMAVEDTVCSVNITAVDKELRDLFGLDDVFAKVALILANDPSLGTYNWTASYLLSMQLQEAITEFILSPLVIEIDDDWWNGTRSRLLDVLQQWGKQLGGIVAPSNPTGGTDINSIIEMITSSLAPLLENSEWYQDVIQSQQIMDEVNKIILHWAQELNGKTIILPYLDGLFENATHVREVLALQELTPEFIELLMSLSMKPEKFQEFFMMDKPFATLCMNSTFAEFFDLPSESNVNISELQRAVCSVNLTAAEHELYYLLQLDSITFKFMQILYNDPSLGPYNWTASVILSQQVQKAIAQLVAGPPVFSVDSQWLNNSLSALKYAFEQQMTSFRDMFGQTDPQQSLENGLQELQTFLNQSGLWYKVQPVLESITLYLDLYITQTEQYVENAKLYLNITIPPDVVADLTSMSVDEIKAFIISNFIPVSTLAYFHSNGLWDTVFCDETAFNQYTYILYDEFINTTALRLVLCETNSTELFQDLQGYYGFDIVQLQEMIGRIFGESPMTRDFDWQELIDLTQELTSLFEEIEKLPSFMHGSWNISEMYARLQALQKAIFEQNIETAMTLLYELSPLFDLEGLGFSIRDLLDAINQQIETLQAWMGMVPATNSTGTSTIELLEIIESSLYEAGVWNRLRPVIEITNLLLGGANEWLYPLGLSPSQVFYNATVLSEVLTTYTDLSPALMETKAITDFVPLLRLAYIHNNDLWEEFWQCANYSEEGFPQLGEDSNLIEMLCTLNRTEFFEDASGLLKVDILELEKQLFSLKYPSPGSNLTTIPLDWEELINNVQLFANAQREILYLLAPVGHGGSISHTLSVIWQAMENIGLFKAPMSGQILEMLAPSLPIDDHFVRSYIPAITVLAEQINAEFEVVRDQGISVTNFFELQIELMDLIQEVLSESDLQAFLHAQINVEMLNGITNFEDVAEIFCDKDQFNLLLTFPPSPEVDVEVIQRSLCDLVKSSKVTIQLGLYHYLQLGAIYQQAVKLYTNNNGAGFPQQDVDWEYSLGELEKVVNNFMNIQISSEDWQTLLMQLSEHGMNQLLIPGSTREMLTQIFAQLDVILMNNTVWHRVKGYIAAVTEVAESINAEFVELRELGINATTFLELQTDLMELIQTILSESELEALLQATVNEEILESSTNLRDVADIVCDEDQFNLLLTFPSTPEIDVGVIQRALCDLIKSSNATVQLGLYHYLKLGTIYQQVIRLFTNNYYRGFPPAEVDFMETLRELNLLMANFMSIDTNQVWHVVMEVLMEGDLLGGFPMLPVTNMTLTPISACEVILPVGVSFLFGNIAQTVLIKSDLFMQVVNQVYFDLPDHEEEIQSLLNNQSLVGELMWTTFQVSPDALTALQGISRDMGQIYLLRALSLDIIEGNLHDVACSEQDLRDLLDIYPEQDLSELSSLICSVDAIIQTELVQELLVIIDFESAATKIKIINGPAYGNLPPLSCSSLFENGEEFVDNMLVLLKDPTAFRLELEIPDLTDLIEDISSIIENVTSGDYNSLQGLLDLVDELLEEDFLSENGTARVVIDELFQLYNSYIDTINKIPGIIPVDSLWWNSSRVATLLLKETGLTVDDITMLMEGSINVTVIAELKNLTVLNWGSMVCDKDVFMRLLILSSDELKNLVYRETCLHPDKEMLFDEISQRFNLVRFLSETSQSAIPVPTFVEFLQEILSSIEKFERLNTTAVENLVNVLPLLKDINDISDLMNFVPVLKNVTLDLDSFEELFDNLEPILGSTPEFQQARALFELLREKEYIVDVLKEFPALTVEKMLKFPSELRLFLEKEIALSSEIVDRIFSALLNPELLLSTNITNTLDNICSKETFKKYLDFAQGTNLTVVADAICGQNISTIGEMFDLLLGSFNADGIIDVLSSSGIIEAITNMTNSFQNITQSLGEIRQLQKTIPTVLESAGSLGEIFDEEMLEELSSGKISAFTLLQENSDLFCDNGGSSKRRRRRRQTLSPPSASGGFCQDLYNSLQSGSFGDIQWAYIKPILLGKILYTPISPASEEIIKKANKPFEDLTEISEIAQSWLRGVTELTNLLESPGLEDIENLLGNSFISGLLESELAIDADALRDILQGDLTSLPVETLNQISVLAELVVNVTSCLELDRFMGFESEDEMETYAARLNMDNLYLAGITFMDLEDATEVPKHVKYALRMDTDRTPSTEYLSDIYWRPGPRGDFLTQQQYLQGFVFLQDMIERAVIELHATSEQLSDVYIQQMPYPCYKNDRYLFIASVIFPLLFTIGFLVLMAVMTHQLVYEKERGIEELMKVMGLQSGVNWFAWFFSNVVLLSILMVVIAIILRIATIVQNTQFSVLVIFLLCFAFSLIMQSYMVSSFFQKANIASLGALLIYLILYVPYGFVFTRGGKVSVIGSLAVSLASPSAFSFGCLIISRYEHQGIGSTWGNIWENPRDEDHSTLAASCIMMVVDGLIYFIIGWYIRTVFPGKFGVPRPWYFPFQASYWCRRIRSDTYRNSTDGGEVNEAYEGEGATAMKEMGAHVESEPMHAPIGIAIQNLSKVYGTRCPSVENRALDKMTLNFFEGQVTALLGSNGAGKTTVISIITGLYPASGGSVNIYDQEVGFNAGVRGNDLGLCPQHNALYDELTVKEHLKLFGKLKGMSKKALTEQGTMLLDELRLLDMLNVPVYNLSGGMKRKLCVAISLMGNAKTVILDEPTSGVDPHARRAVWDLIIRSKKDRTIVLCTHFMDEADLLGDRIAILDRGQLRCCGSSAFLKSKFTSGVKLTLSKERPSGSSTPQSSKKLAIGEGKKVAKGNTYEDLPVSTAKEAGEEDGDRGSSSSSSGVSSQRDLCDSAKVTQFLTSRVDGITLLKEVGSELVYQLPSTQEEKAKFPQLFRDLDEQLPALHIRNYGVSDTNLEEVFLKVSTHSDSFMESNVDQSAEITEDPPKWNKNQYGHSNDVMFGAQFTSAFQQVRGIFWKRFHITRRDWRGFIWAVLMPVAMLAVGTAMAKFYPVPVFPPLQLTPAMFKDPNYVFFSNGETSSIVGERLTKAFFNAPGIGTTCMSDAEEMDIYPCEFTETFFPEPISDLTDEEKRAILEEDLLSPLCVCEDGRSVCDEEAGGVGPPEWITNTSAILQDLSLKTDVTEYLLSTRLLYEQNRYGGVTFVDIKDGNINRTVIKAWYSNIGYHALPAYINVANNILLRASLPAGSNPAEYGITAYNHPIELAEALPDITGWNIASVQFGLVLFLMTALAMVPATLSTLMVQENLNGAKRLHFVSGITPARYWLTNLMWDMLIYIVPAILIIIVLLIFGIQGFISDQNVGTFILLLIVYGFAIFSQYYLLVPIFSDTGTAFVMYFCSNLILFLLTNLPTFVDYLQLANYQRWEALPVLNDIFLIFTPFCISSALLTMLYNQLETDIYASFGVERITDPLYMVRWNIIAMVIHAVVAMTVLLLLEYRKKKRMNCNPSAASRSPYDQEDEDVEEERDRVSSGGAAGDVISLRDITKVYSVRRRKITAVDHISFGVPRGECFGLLGVNGAGKTTLFKTITTAIAPSGGTIQLNAKSIGYCPQVDAIYDQLTGEEILYCYARLKGIKEEYVKEVVEDISAKMGMGDFSRKVISTYSGGMKRTLSVAVSLLGDPQLVLMDEPTAGMDPVSKQAVWRGIQAAILDGRSVIVTSHSMEECENLCTRLAIMVNGQFRCLGSPQHVKHRHGEGYTLILHLLSGDEKSADLNSVARFMEAKFPESVLKEHHLTMLRYQLSSTGFCLADIYEAVEKERDTLGIEEYSVTQTTLDQVFVNFAKKQTDGHGDDASSISSLGIANPAFDPETLTVV